MTSSGPFHSAAARSATARACEGSQPLPIRASSFSSARRSPPLTASTVTCWTEGCVVVTGPPAP